MGLFMCWIVGMGRYWDDPQASLLQHAGVGSVLYVFMLAGLMWLVVKPIEPQRFSYFNVLTFITLTSPPAALYALPVERWMNLEQANLLNLRVLAVVALWRVALWYSFVVTQGKTTRGVGLVVVGLPLAAIFIALTYLNLSHAVLDIMGGIRDASQTAHDTALKALAMLSVLSLPVSLLAGFAWLCIVLDRRRDRRVAREAKLSR
jgi:hypothetical protein